jgi:hypothetical protein
MSIVYVPPRAVALAARIIRLVLRALPDAERSRHAAALSSKTLIKRKLTALQSA